MKILIFNWQDITNPHAGGAETHLHEIFSRIAALGHAVTLFCSSYRGAKPEETIDGIRVIREGHRNVFNAFVPLRYLTRFRHEGYDIIVDDLNKIPFFTPLFVKEPLLVIAHHLFAHSIFAEVGRISGSYVYAAEWLMNHIYRTMPFAVVSESTLQEFVERGFRRENFSIIYNCIDQKQFPFAVLRKHAVPTIAYFGRLKRYKSVHHLLQAFAIVRKQLPTTELRIMGKGDAEPELQALSATLGVQDAVRFCGFISESQKASALAAVHCVVNPSMKEGWGIINIEANACGTPIISANVPGLRDSVRHGESGLLYEYGNIEQLANELITLLSDDGLRLRLSEGAVAFARQFDWDNSARLMVERLEGVIQTRQTLGTTAFVHLAEPTIPTTTSATVSARSANP